jgi:hypothetical protein
MRWNRDRSRRLRLKNDLVEQLRAEGHEVVDFDFALALKIR